MFLVCTEFCVDVWGFTVSFVFYRIEPCFTASTDFLWSPPNCRSPSCSAEDRPFHLRPAPRLLLFLFAPSPLGFLLFFPRFPLFFFSGCIFFCFFGCFTFFSSFLSPSFSLQPLNVYSVPTALDFNVSLFFSFFFNQLWLFPLGRPVQRFSLLCNDGHWRLPSFTGFSFRGYATVRTSLFSFFFLVLRRRFFYGVKPRHERQCLRFFLVIFFLRARFLFVSLVLLRSIASSRLLDPIFTWFYRVLPGFTGFYRVLPFFFGFCWTEFVNFISLALVGVTIS